MRPAFSIPLLIAFLARAVSAQQTSPANSTPPVAPQESALYSNRSLQGTYRLNYLSSWDGGEVTYDGHGHFEGHDQYSRIDSIGGNIIATQHKIGGPM